MAFELGLLYSFRNPPRWPLPQKQVYDDTLAHIVDMETAGFDTIWVTEHHFSEDGYLPSLAIMTATIAALTSRVTIGQGIIELPLHHPVALAEDLAVADIVSGGRVRAGVGLGRMNFDWRPSFEHEGLVFGAPNVGRHRARMFEEQVEILKKCWKNEPFRHKGEFYDFPEINVTPKPLQKDGPEIWFGVGDQATKALDRAARMGHGWTGGAAGLENYLAKVKAQGREAEAAKAVVFMSQLPAEDPEAMQAKYGDHLDYVLQWYNPERPVRTPSTPDASGRVPGWFAEPAAIAKDLDDLQARGATGALWFAPFVGLSAHEASPFYAALVAQVRPLMSAATGPAAA